MARAEQREELHLSRGWVCRRRRGLEARVKGTLVLRAERSPSGMPLADAVLDATAVVETVTAVGVEFFAAAAGAGALCGEVGVAEEF